MFYFFRSLTALETLGKISCKRSEATASLSRSPFPSCRSNSVTEPEPVPLVQKGDSVTEPEPVPLVEREGSNSVTESEVCIAILYQGDISIRPIGVGQN